jgi:hypothetical protein
MLAYMGPHTGSPQEHWTQPPVKIGQWHGKIANPAAG